MTSKTSYIDSMGARMVHAPIILMWSKRKRGHIQVGKDKTVEPKLVVGIISIAKHDKFYPIRIASKEVLSFDFPHSCTKFLLCNNVLKVEKD